MQIPIFEETQIYDYIYTVICSENNELFDYVCNLIYKLLFNRGILAGILLCLYNESKGVGKSLFFNFLSNLIGDEYACKTDKPDNLFSNFNALIRFKLLVCLEESNIEMKHMDTVKDYITSTKITTTKKCEDTVQTANYALFCQTTNTLPFIEEGCRRIKVIQTSSHRKGDTEYWSDLLQEMGKFEYKYSFYKYIEQNYKNTYDQMFFQNNFPETNITKQIKKDNCTPFMAFLIYIYETYSYVSSAIESGDEVFENFEDIERNIYDMYNKFETNSNNSSYVKTKEIYDIYTHFHTYIKNQDKKYMIPMNKLGNHLSNENYNSFIDKKVLHHQSIYKINYKNQQEYLKNLGKI
jgi:phage/plasmid-associated DNA primase